MKYYLYLNKNSMHILMDKDLDLTPSELAHRAEIYSKRNTSARFTVEDELGYILYEVGPQ